MLTRLKKVWALGLTLVILGVGSTGLTQDKKEAAKAKEAPKEALKEEAPKQSKLHSMIRAGYTRPGSPADKLGKNGEIIQVALQPDLEGPVIGATVYFAVFRNTGDDTFAKEVGEYFSLFVEGRSFENTFSPEFDRKAKYLYVYQIVNDRGLLPLKDSVLPAVDGDLLTANISSFALRLIVDPRYITSWGHFRELSFAGNFEDRKVSKDGIVGAAEDTRILPMALSSNPSVERMLPQKRFLERAPAHSLGDLASSFGLARADLGLKNSSAWFTLNQKAENKAVKLVNWEENQLKDPEGALEPDFVQLLYDVNGDNQTPTVEGRNIGQTIFRVDFKKANLMKAGQRSVVFGFTSDLPPTDEPIRVEGPLPIQAKGKIKGVAFDDPEGGGIAPAAAVGTAPTPVGGGAVAPVAGAVPAVAGLGGYGGVGGGGLGVAPAAAGGIGAARPGGASGFGGGNGGGQGQGTTQADQGQEQQPGTINFTATLINQQAQAQAQAQFQNQNNGCCPGTEVIPEPTAIVLGLLGLPALVFLRRRQPQAS